MKSRILLLLATAFLTFSTALRAAEAPKLETLLAEYKKARSDVLGKLNESYATQADAMAAGYQKAANLDGADRAKHFAKALRETDGASEAQIAPNANLNDPLTNLQAHYAQARDVNLANVHTFYVTTADNLRKELLKTNDGAGAAVLATFIEKITPATTPTPTPKGKPAAKAATPAKASKAPAK